MNMPFVLLALFTSMSLVSAGEPASPSASPATLAAAVARWEVLKDLPNEKLESYLLTAPDVPESQKEALASVTVLRGKLKTTLELRQPGHFLVRQIEEELASAEAQTAGFVKTYRTGLELQAEIAAKALKTLGEDSSTAASE